MGPHKWKTEFYTVVLRILLKNLTAELSASAPVVYKNPSSLCPEILYTTGAGKGFKVSAAIFASSGGGV